MENATIALPKGDDSLLIKYFNPHVAVVVTATEMTVVSE